ncbi:sigma-70 family RNA polymerase sigma factor [Phycisphaerales bacterium AB-hyl4]|uniref:Sigma-70 family RNA polymerase sigma factor n=1 Tax=Natronomicrosphaera hydrolytica TaxID=3242702 RepID=A0ABV4U8U3_9BACT
MTTHHSEPENAEPSLLGEIHGGANGSLETLTDQELMRRVSQADEAALEALFDRYNRTVYAICLRVLRNPSDAEETLVDVFWELWAQSARFNARRGSVSTYLMMLARSRAIDHHRSRAARSRAGNSTSPLDVDDRGDDGKADPAERVWITERRQQVRTALGSLSPDQREAVVLSFFNGMSHQQIAEELDKPLGTIKTRIRLGLIRLRDALRSTGGGEESHR